MQSIGVPHGLLGKFTYQIVETGFSFHESYRTKLVESIQQGVASSAPSWTTTSCPNDTLSILGDVQMKCIVTIQPGEDAVYSITIDGSNSTVVSQVKGIVISVLGISEFDGSIQYPFY